MTIMISVVLAKHSIAMSQYGTCHTDMQGISYAKCFAPGSYQSLDTGNWLYLCSVPSFPGTISSQLLAKIRWEGSGRPVLSPDRKYIHGCVCSTPKWLPVQGWAPDCGRISQSHARNSWYICRAGCIAPDTDFCFLFLLFFPHGEVGIHDVPVTA